MLRIRAHNYRAFFSVRTRSLVNLAYVTQKDKDKTMTGKRQDYKLRDCSLSVHHFYFRSWYHVGH